jgi:23S rRNA (uracil1939-C5)-methyltransferase
MGPETSASDIVPEPQGRDPGAAQPPHLAEESDGGPVIELDLTDLAYGGDAVGRYQGRAVFVTGGLPGEVVRAQLIRERSNYARAALLEVLRRSPERIEPSYPELGESGGFQWQHLAYPAQLVWKTRIVRQLLARIGRFVGAPVLPALGMPATTDPWRYRTVAQFAIGVNGAIGFRRASSHDVLDMPVCPIVHPALDALYQQVRSWMLEQWGAAASGFAERFTLRIAADPTVNGGDTNAGLLAIEARPGSAFDTAGGPEAVGEALLEAAPALAGVVVLGLPGGRGRMVVGQDFIYDRVLDRVFRISAGSFFQVNATQTPILIQQTMEAAAPRGTDWALDGYSGVGLFSLFLADAVTHVHAIESQPSAVSDARASAALNNITNVTVTEGVLERVLGGVVRQRERVDVALVDPPRSGCHPRALTQIRQLGPRALVYISCDPSTLARDLQLFCGEGDYQLVSVQPVDMFPFTSHVECVALCQRVR